MIQYIQTDLRFDVSRMQQETAQLSSPAWKAHYNAKHYEGDWSVLPLRAIGGNAENATAIQATAGSIPYADTPLLDMCPYLQSVLASFRCEKTSVRLMKLNAGAIIKEHTDHDMHMEAGEARFHIPIQTNKDVAFYIMEDKIPMREGECWYLNLSLPHRVHNAGTTDRIHLVIDVMVNDWVKDLLSKQGIQRKEIEGLPVKPLTTAEQLRVIEALRQMNTETSLSLAEKMEASL